MLNIRTILHGTDFSNRADCAFQLACSLAKDYRARLVVLHVSAGIVIGSKTDIASHSEEFLAEARQKLDKLAVPAEVRIERRLAQGNPSEEILHIAQEIKADLIVLGTHGRSGLARVLMGSVAEDVLRKASCPVLTVKIPLSQTEPVEEHGSFHEGEVCRA